MLSMFKQQAITQATILFDTWSTSGYKYFYHGFGIKPFCLLILACDATTGNLNYSIGYVTNNDVDYCIYTENANTQNYRLDAGYIYRDAGNLMRITSTVDSFTQSRIRLNAIVTGAVTAQVTVLIFG